jgi:hypothetical protein
MKPLLLLASWLILLVISWPLALLALILAPIVWLISLPLRLLGVTVGGVFTLLKAIVTLPSRLTGYRSGPREPRRT